MIEEDYVYLKNRIIQNGYELFQFSQKYCLQTA